METPSKQIKNGTLTSSVTTSQLLEGYKPNRHSSRSVASSSKKVITPPVKEFPQKTSPRQATGRGQTERR
eukprot:6090286-Ditylum_brightwellii.AAC.1